MLNLKRNRGASLMSVLIAVAFCACASNAPALDAGAAAGAAAAAAGAVGDAASAAADAAASAVGAAGDATGAAAAAATGGATGTAAASAGTGTNAAVTGSLSVGARSSGVGAQGSGELSGGANVAGLVAGFAAEINAAVGQASNFGPGGSASGASATSGPMGASTRNTVDLRRVFESMSASEQERTRRRCRDVIARPAGVDAETVALCRTIAALTR